MFKKPNCPVIAVEEHYWDAELSKTYVGLESGRPGPADGPAVRPRRAAPQGDGRGRHRHAGDLARRAFGAEASGRWRGGARSRRQRPAGGGLRRQSQALPGLRGAALERSEGRRRRARAHRDQARLQGRDDARAVRRRVPRRQAVLADLRARREARRADLFSSRDAGSARDGRLLQRLRQGLPDGGARRLGLHGRDRDHGDPHGAVRRVRQAPESEGDPRPSRRDAAVPGLARRSRHRAAGRGASRSASAIFSATTSGSPPAATSPIRR